MLFMAFYCQIIFHCMDNAVFVFPVSRLAFGLSPGFGSPEMRL